MRDKRKYVRLAVNTAVTYVAIDEKSQARPALSRNVGCGGLQLCLHNKVVAGSDLRLEIYLPTEERPIQVRARAVWQDDVLSPGGWYNTGVRFTEITNSDRARIARYVLNEVRRAGPAGKLTFWQKFKLLILS